MVRIQSFGGPVAPLKSKKQTAGKKKRAEMEAGEGSAPLVESGPPAMLPALPPPEDPPAMPTALPIVPTGVDRAGEEEEEREEVVPSLKRRKLVRLGDLPSGQAEKGKKKGGAGEKGKEKVAAEGDGKWESAISLAKTASISDLDVSLHIAEKVVTPVDEEFMESFSDMQLASRLVRANMRGLTMAFDAYRRIERLVKINQSQGPEILKLTTRAKTLGDEVSGVKEERDLLKAQLSSLEGERKSWEDEKKSWGDTRDVLESQIAIEVEENRQLREERDRLFEERERLKKEITVVRERSTKYLLDCQAAIESKFRTEDVLKELRCSIARQRVEAIKRWKRRHLNAECLELACDITLTVLGSCHEAHFPAGSDGPSFEEYAKPLLPALGLSLEEMREQAEGGKPDIPDEELDLSSAEEDEEPNAPLNPAPVLTITPLPALPPDTEVTPGHLSAAEAPPRQSPADEYSPGYSPSPSADF